MANKMTALFAQYTKLKKEKEQTWNMAYAVTNSKARKALTERAMKLDRQLLNTMRKINREADKLGVKKQRVRRKKTIR